MNFIRSSAMSSLRRMPKPRVIGSSIQLTPLPWCRLHRREGIIAKLRHAIDATADPTINVGCARRKRHVTYPPDDVLCEASARADLDQLHRPFRLVPPQITRPEVDCCITNGIVLRRAPHRCSAFRDDTSARPALAAAVCAAKGLRRA